MWVTKERQSQKISTVNKAAFLIQGNWKTLGLDGEQKIAWVLFNSVLSEKVVKRFGLRNGCKVSHFGMKIEKVRRSFNIIPNWKRGGVCMKTSINRQGPTTWRSVVWVIPLISPFASNKKNIRDHGLLVRNVSRLLSQTHRERPLRRVL